jgi:threonine/homoserine/homoserine lactone efflux protein
MPSLETLLVFTVAAMMLNISPGPSNLYVMARSISQGPSAGVLAAAGLAIGSLVHVFGAALGLSVLFRSSAVAYEILKYAGAAYLIWLGIQAWRDSARPLDAVRVNLPKAPRTILRESVLVEALNPKTALFFLAFLPQFADPAAGPLVPQILVLGLVVTVTAIPCDLLVAFASGKVAGALRRRPWIKRLQDRVSGTILIGLGLLVATSERTR